MKYILLVLCAVICSAKSYTQRSNPNYDSLLAKKTGADEYGMKNYVFVILKTGENKSTDKQYRDSCFSGHMQNIKRLVSQNKLVVAGPFGKNEEEFRGLFILNVSTVEEGKALVETDPAVKAGFLKAQLYPWYGSAALSEYLAASDKVWKTGF